MRKIMIVDSDNLRQMELSLDMPDEIEMLSAFSVEDAKAIFQAHPDLVLIAVDSGTKSQGLETVRLLQAIRRRFSGPIIAVSPSIDVCRVMRMAGANHECRRPELAQKIWELLEPVQ